MYSYGALTAPNPDKMAISVTPMTPTRLISCSMEKIPANSKYTQKITMPCRLSLRGKRGDLPFLGIFAPPGITKLTAEPGYPIKVFLY